MGLVPFSVLLVNRPGKIWVAPRAAGSCIIHRAIITNVHSRGFSLSWATTGDGCQGGVSVFNPAGNVVYGDDRTVSNDYPRGNPNWASPSNTNHVTLLFSERPAEGLVKVYLMSSGVLYGVSLDPPVPEGGSDFGPIPLHLPENPSYNPAQLPSPSNTPGAYGTEKDAFSECPNGKLASSCSGTNEKACVADSTLCCHKACFRPYPIWGEIKAQSGNPVEGALVFAIIPTNTSGFSNIFSTLTNSQGRWTLELANLHKTISGANASDGSNISPQYFVYNTNLDTSGVAREPDKVFVGAIAPKVGSSGFDLNLPDPYHPTPSVQNLFPLHSVTDAVSCPSRNTCSNHACTMENPSPICITLGEASGSPTCTSLTLDKTVARADETVTATLRLNSGSSGFKDGQVLIHAATADELRQNNQHYIGPLTFFNGKTGAQTTTFSFVPSNFNVGIGANIVWLTIENTNSQACTDRPAEYPVGRPDWPLCGCGAKNLTIAAADAPQISEVRPNRGLRGTEVTVAITGSKLHPEVTYKLSRGSDNINGTVNATPAPSATAVSVKFNIPSSTATGNWNLVATKGTSTASYPFIIVDSAEATVVTFFVELQGLDKPTSPRRQLKVNVGDQDYVVESLPQAQGRYVGAFVLPSSVTGLKEFKVWEPEVRLKRKFSGTVTSGDINYYDWTGKKILAGDFDGNNKITLADFTGPQGILKPLQTGNKISLPITDALKKYDVNGDNVLNVLDISLVLLNFSGLEVPGE